MLDCDLENTDQIEPIALGFILNILSNTYNREGRPDWSRANPNYR